MKKKAFLFGGIGAAVVVIAVILIFLLTKEKGYRSILVIEINGNVSVTRDGQTIEAYPQMKLRSGDGMTVPAGGYARLKLDDDKYVFLEEDTVISLEAAGTAAKSRTIVYVDQGTMLTEIQKKLSSDSSYDIVTPNTTMAIRGTITLTSVKQGYANPEQQITEYTADMATSDSASPNDVLCWITDNYVIEGQTTLTVYNVDGADIVYLNRVLRSGNGVHVITPVTLTAGNSYVRKFQVSKVQVFWGKRDKRPDTGTGKVRERTTDTSKGIFPIAGSYAVFLFPNDLDPNTVKGTEGPMNQTYTLAVIEFRNSGGQKDPNTPDNPDGPDDPDGPDNPNGNDDPNGQGNNNQGNNNQGNNNQNNKPVNNNQSGNTQQGNNNQSSGDTGNTNTGTQTGDNNGSEGQTGDNSGTQTGDSTGTQTGENNGSEGQTGDNNGTQTGDDTGTQTGDNGGSENTEGGNEGVTPINTGENGKTDQPIIITPTGDDTGDDNGDDDPVTYTITFHYLTPDPTEDVTDTGSYEAGEGVPEFASLNDTDTHYFDCWLNANGKPVESISEDETGDIDLYAQWTPRTYNVFFYNDEEEIDSHEYTYGIGLDSVYFPSYDKLGFREDDPYIVFNGWKDSRGNIYKSISGSMTGDISLYADITARTYSITYIVNGQPRTFDDKYMSYVAGVGKDYEEFPTLDNTDFEEFLGWAFSATADVRDYIHSEMVGDVELYPVWTPKKFTIIYYSGGRQLPSETYTFGKDYDLKEGYTWYTPGDYENVVTSLNSKDFGDKTFYAQTSANEVTIVFGNVSTATVSLGSSTAIPDPGEGKKWVGTNGTTGEYDYYDLVDSTGMAELAACNSDMFFTAVQK